MPPVIVAFGARLAPLFARVLSAGSWASLGWLMSDVSDVVETKDQPLSKFTHVMTAIAFLAGAGIAIAIYSLAKRKK